MARALAVIVLLAVTASARADGLYFTEQMGGSDIHDELGAYYDSALALRIAVGMRQGRWAFEAFVAGHIDQDSGTPTKPAAGEPYVDDYQALTTYGIDVKYLQPLNEYFEGYVRGRISRGIGEGVALDGYEGRGLGIGAGAQIKGKVRALGFLAWPFFFLKVGPKVTGALFLDATQDFYRLHPGGRLHATPAPGQRSAIDAKVTTISVGFAIGSDF